MTTWIVILMMVGIIAAIIAIVALTTFLFEDWYPTVENITLVIMAICLVAVMVLTTIMVAGGTPTA